MGNKTEVVAWSNSGRINGGGDGFLAAVSQAGNGCDPVGF